MKCCTCYFFNDMIDIKHFDPVRIQIDKKSYENIIIYYNGYFTIENVRYTNISSLNPLYFIINKADRFTEERR